jgi:hypothetical protein
MGSGPNNVLSTYGDNRKDTARTELEDSPLGTVMLGIASNGGALEPSFLVRMQCQRLVSFWQAAAT